VQGASYRRRIRVKRTTLTNEEQRAAEIAACTPEPLRPGGFNRQAVLPYGLTVAHVEAVMAGFLDFLGFINGQMNARGIERLESMLMPANFSSIVGEFMSSTLPKHCPGLVKNAYHNGHPDLLPKGHYTGDATQHGEEGIEIKGSRYLKGWQGHNPEDTWLMVFVFDSNRPADGVKASRPFRFVKVVGARLEKADWTFAGRSETSRRTITASVNETGYAKAEANWIYRVAKDAMNVPAGSISE
jgi:hypothetical protein